VARHCYLHGQQYQIVDGKVMIVDEYTGRFLPIARGSTACTRPSRPRRGSTSRPIAKRSRGMSFQRFFRTYPFLCGMTGTAADATGEIESVYSAP
jgi:preprotein translocase subunit SecA